MNERLRGVKIQVPYLECHTCPLALRLCENEGNNSPFDPSDIRKHQIRLNKIAIACILHNKNFNLATLAGIREDISIVNGEQDFHVRYVKTIQGEPPEYCPQKQGEIK